MVLRTSGRGSSLSPAPLSTVTQLGQVIPRPGSRCFYVAQTRAGKSTLATASLGEYHRWYPDHYIWIVDLKGRGRYLAVEREQSNDPLFPDGVLPQVRDGRRVVPVVAEEMGKRPRFPVNGDRCTVVHSLEGTINLCKFLYTEGTVDRPNVVYFDETIDLMRGDFRAVEPVRKLSQHGGELAIGAWHVNQMPSYVDRTWFTEATQLYVGRLVNEEDREKVARHVTVPGAAAYLEAPLPPYHFLYIDQEREKLAKFNLQGVA